MKGLKVTEPVPPGTLLSAALIPGTVLKDPTLSAAARLLWVLLGEHQGKSVDCFPPQDVLAIPLGVKVRQLQNLSKELENYTRGDPPEPVPLIEVKLVFVEKDQKTRNIYKLLRQPFLAVDLKANCSVGSHMADGGHSQYSAPRSEGEAQATSAAPSTLPTQDGGAVSNCMPPIDAQSFAYRSGGDTQSVAAGRPDGSDADVGADLEDTLAAPPELPSAGGCDGIPNGDTPSCAHRSGGEAQDTAVTVAIPSEESSAQYCAHWSGDDPQDPGAGRAGSAGEDGGVDGGDAQCFAHRSGGDRGDTQDAADGRTAIPKEDGGGVPDDMPPGDAQSFAHRSEGDAQDTVAARPAIPSEHGGTVPDGMAALRDMYAKGQLLRQQQMQALAPRFDRYAYRPLGPGDCVPHSLTQRCQKCGASVNPAHMITRVISGFFCETCCPACHPAG